MKMKEIIQFDPENLSFYHSTPYWSFECDLKITDDFGGCFDNLLVVDPTPPTPIIHEHKIVQNIIQPPNRVLVERKICTRIDGCPEKNGTCPTCSVEKVWE